MSRQPFGFLYLGVAFQAKKWDNNHHSWREGEFGRTAAKHTLPKSRLRSYLSESKLEEKDSPASGGLAGFQSRVLRTSISPEINNFPKTQERIRPRECYPQTGRT